MELEELLKRSHNKEKFLDTVTGKIITILDWDIVGDGYGKTDDGKIIKINVKNLKSTGLKDTDTRSDTEKLRDLLNELGIDLETSEDAEKGGQSLSNIGVDEKEEKAQERKERDKKLQQLEKELAEKIGETKAKVIIEKISSFLDGTATQEVANVIMENFGIVDTRYKSITPQDIENATIPEVTAPNFSKANDSIIREENKEINPEAKENDGVTQAD